MTASRTDKKCGASGIPDTAKCTKGSALAKAGKAALGAGAVAGAAYALKKGGGQKLGNFAQRKISEGGKFKMSGKFLNKMKPMSKTERLHVTAKKANKSAEQAIKRAKEAEINRAVAVGEAMYKSGQATRASLVSGARRHRLTVEKARRKYEPGYPRRRRDLGSFYKDAQRQTVFVRDRLSKIMDNYKQRTL